MQSYFKRATRGVILGVAVLGFACAIAPGLFAQSKTIKDGVYTAAQAKRGEALFQEHCSSCHGADLSGGGGPSLTGADFFGFWDKMPLSDLVEKINTSMPADSPGSVNRKQTADIVAFIVQFGKFPAGQTELSDDAAALKAIAITK